VLTFDDDKVNTTQNVGSLFTIPVTVSGHPSPLVTWSFSDGPMESTATKTVDSHTTLTLKNITKPQQGTYTVKAENVAGETSVEFTITLKGIHSSIKLYSITG